MNKWVKKVEMKDTKDDSEEYLTFWRQNVDRLYEIGKDMTVIFHGEEEEMIYQELL